MFPVCILKNTYILKSDLSMRLANFKDVQSLKGRRQNVVPAGSESMQKRAALVLLESV